MDGGDVLAHKLMMLPHSVGKCPLALPTNTADAHDAALVWCRKDS